jgi:hypothetical protein
MNGRACTVGVLVAQIQRWQSMPSLPSTTYSSPALPEDLARIRAQCLPAHHFVTGMPHSRCSASHSYFSWSNAGGPLTQAQAQVLAWLQHGVSVQWVAVRRSAQQKHPRFAKRLGLVTLLLHQTFPDDKPRVQALLQGNVPGQVSFKNLQSVHQHMDFVTTAVAELLTTGAVEEVTEAQIHVCNGLAVVVNHKGRFCHSPCHFSVLLIVNRGTTIFSCTLMLVAS